MEQVESTGFLRLGARGPRRRSISPTLPSSRFTGREISAAPALVALVALLALTAGSTTAGAAQSQPLSKFGTPVTVAAGIEGAEPLIRTSPDGSAVYISALQHLFVSHDRGKSFQEVAAQPVLGTPLSSGDSSIDVAPGGRLYLSIMNPGSGGPIAVCSSADEARTFSCQPSAVASLNDRQWLVADTNDRTYMTSNAAIMQTTLFRSDDRGVTFRPMAAAKSVVQPGVGPLVKARGRLFQPFIDVPLESTQVENELSAPLSVYEWDPAAPLGVPTVHRTPLPAGASIASLAATANGTLYITSEGISGTNPDGRVRGKDVRLARSKDGGKSWVSLPPVPGTEVGTSAFSWVAAEGKAHVGVISYRTATGGRAITNTGTWDVMWSETRNADSARPSWRTTVVERRVHRGSICAPGCGPGRFAGDLINASFDGRGRPHLAWVRDMKGQPEIRYTTVR